MKTSNNLKRGKFSEGAADIFLDGQVIGWMEKETTSEFRSASSRATKTKVCGYTVMITVDAIDAHMKEGDFSSISEAMEAVAKAIELASSTK